MQIKKHIRFFIFISIGLFLIFTPGCKKEKHDIPVQEKGTVSDVDGNTYKTIKIGNQWWMAENLKVTRYNDSTKIPVVNISTTALDATWANKTSGACCMYDNDNSNLSRFGLLYNWYAVNDNLKLAPKGWHIPSDNEWKELEKRLGMSATDADKTSWRGTREAEKLKTAAYNAWVQYGDIWPNNESGFTALAGGCCMFDGRFGQPGTSSVGFWWSSSLEGNEAWYRYLDYKNANVFRYYGPKTYGFSVRCVKD